MSDVAKAELSRYLQEGRDAILWKMEGLSEYDVRRPLTPTGTNLLGLVKHLAGVEAEYFGVVFNRPFARKDCLAFSHCRTQRRHVGAP